MKRCRRLRYVPGKPLKWIFSQPRCFMYSSLSSKPSTAKRSSDSVLADKLSKLVSLSDAEVLAITQMPSRVRDFKAHAESICEYHSTKMLLVLEGFGCRYRTTRDGSRQHLAYLLPGDLVDLASTGLDKIGTLSACRVAYVSRSDFQDVLARHPQIAEAYQLARTVEEATTREWLLNLGCRTAAERIAHLFCELFVRLLSVGLVREESYAFPVNQHQLSATVALSPVHLNRSLQALRRTELIELRGRRLRIKDPTKLREFAGFEPDYLQPMCGL